MTQTDKIDAAKWNGEPCHNPEKGWIRDSRGNRLTRLGNRNAFGKIIQKHNQEVDLLAHSLAAERDQLREDVRELVEACKWLDTYAKVQIERHPDADDTPNWKKLVAALAKHTGE